MKKSNNSPCVPGHPVALLHFGAVSACSPHLNTGHQLADNFTTTNSQLKLAFLKKFFLVYLWNFVRK